MSAPAVVQSDPDALLGEVFKAARPKKKINKALRTFNKRVSTFGGKIGRTTGISDERSLSDSGSDNEDNLNKYFYHEDDGAVKDDEEFRVIHDTLIPASEVEAEEEGYGQKSNFIKAADVYGAGFEDYQQQKIENEEIMRAHRHELNMREHIDATMQYQKAAAPPIRPKKKQRQSFPPPLAAENGGFGEIEGHEFSAIPQKYHHQYRNYLKRNAAAEKRAAYEAQMAQEQQRLHSDRYFSYLDDVNRQKQRQREAEEEEKRNREVWQQFINPEDDQVNDEIENAKRRRKAKKHSSNGSRSTSSKSERHSGTVGSSSSSDGKSSYGDYKTVATAPSDIHNLPQPPEISHSREISGSPVAESIHPASIHAPSIHNLPPPSPAISEAHHTHHHSHHSSRPPSLVHPSGGSTGSPEFDDDEPLLPPLPNPVILDPTQPQPEPARPRVSMAGAATKAGNILFESDPNPSKYSAKALFTKLKKKNQPIQEGGDTPEIMATPTMPGGFEHAHSLPATPMMVHPEAHHPSHRSVSASHRSVSGGESLLSQSTVKPQQHPQQPPQEEADHGEELYGYWLSTKKYFSDTIWGQKEQENSEEKRKDEPAPASEAFGGEENIAAHPAAHATSSRSSRSAARSRAVRSADLKHPPSITPSSGAVLKTPTLASAAVTDFKSNLHPHDSDMKPEEEEAYYNSDDEYEAKERRRRKFKKAMNFVFQRKVSTPSHPLNDDPLHTPTAPPASSLYDAPSMRSGAPSMRSGAPSIRSTYSRQTIAPTIPDGASMMSYRTRKSRSFAPSLRSKHSSRSIHAPPSISPSGSMSPDHFSEHESAAAENSGEEKTGLVATWNSMTAGVHPVFSNFVQAFRSYAKLSIVLKPVDAVADAAPSMQSVVVVVELLLLMWILYQVSIVIETMATFVKTLCMPVIIVSRMVGMKM